MLCVHDRHPIVMKTQSKGWRLSVRTKLAVIGSLHPLLCTLHVVLLCSCSMFVYVFCLYVWTFAVGLGLDPRVGFAWDHFFSVLLAYTWIVFSTDRAQIELCLLFILSPVCPVCLLQNFVLHSCVIYFLQVLCFIVISVLAWNWNGVFVLDLALCVGVLLVTLYDIS